MKTAAKEEPLMLLEIANRDREREKVVAKKAKGGINLR